MVYAYPALCQMHKDAIRQSVTANYSGQPRGGEASRTTENAAFRAMLQAEEKEYEAVKMAIAKTEGGSDGKARINLIRLIYWDRTHTLEGAAQEVHVSYRTARRWHRAFIVAVGENYGFFA